MSYEIRTAIVDPKTGYDKAANQYHQYREHLDSFDKGMFVKFLPRDLSHCDILDVGAGDGRVFRYFAKQQLGTYTACDVSEKLLARHPNGPHISKVVCDLEEELPFEDQSFDIVMTFFVLEHIEHIQNLFAEVERVMRPGAVWIANHFKQRRAFEYKVGHEKFKIELHQHHLSQLQELAEENFLKCYVEEVEEDGIVIGEMLVMMKE